MLSDEASHTQLLAPTFHLLFALHGPWVGSGPRVGFKGPGWLRAQSGFRAPLCAWFSSHPGAACRGTTFLCLLLREGTHSHAPPRSIGLSGGQASQVARAHLGRPAGLSTQEPSTGPSLQSIPSPPVGQTVSPSAGLE